LVPTLPIADESGILSVTGVEAVFEKTISVEEQEQLEKEQAKKDEDTWSKLGDTISQFFAKTDKEGEAPAGEEAGDGTANNKAESEDKPKEKEEAKKEEKKTDKRNEKEKKKEPKKPKVETVKEELAIEEER
jgi:hypothetical protein